MTSQAKMFLAMLQDGADGQGPVSADGTRQGAWEFSTGAHRRASGVLLDGAPHGVWLVWDARGQMRSQSEWDRGAPCGRWVTWDAEGNIERVDLKGSRDNDDVLVVLGQRAAADALPV